MKKLLFLLFGGFPLLLLAQLDTIPTNRTTIFQYLQQDSLLSLHFITNVKKLKKIEADPVKHKAKLRLGNTAVEKTKWKVRLEQRGKLRREICHYKPQRIKFSKKQLAKRGLVPRRNVKMVMSCMGGKSADKLALREYLAYRLYNILTDESYQVQLVQATFEDTLKAKNNFQTYGFLIEPTKEIGIRKEASISESPGRTTENLYPKAYLRMAVFNYMVGNTDWHIKLAHNVKFLKIPGDSLYTPIPYDFDFTGLVDAHYAIPNEKLPIEDVTQRLFIGAYKEEAMLKETLQLFQDKKEEMKKLILEFPYLNEKERRSTWNYLEGFFNKIEKTKDYKWIFPKETVFQDIMKLEKRKLN